MFKLIKYKIIILYKKLKIVNNFKYRKILKMNNKTLILKKLKI